jgi:hypothetical protein
MCSGSLGNLTSLVDFFSYHDLADSLKAGVVERPQPTLLVSASLTTEIIRCLKNVQAPNVCYVRSVGGLKIWNKW